MDYSTTLFVHSSSVGGGGCNELAVHDFLVQQQERQTILSGVQLTNIAVCTILHFKRFIGRLVHTYNGWRRRLANWRFEFNDRIIAFRIMQRDGEFIAGSGIACSLFFYKVLGS